MTLTEQWKKGELKEGWYYMLLFSNEEYITFIDGSWVVDDRLIGADIKEVLAPVPSYEEYLTMKDCAKMVFEAAERETKLKELLKLCKESIENYRSGKNYNFTADNIVRLIDNAIGEKK